MLNIILKEHNVFSFPPLSPPHLSPFPLPTSLPFPLPTSLPSLSPPLSLPSPHLSPFPIPPSLPFFSLFQVLQSSELNLQLAGDEVTTLKEVIRPDTSSGQIPYGEFSTHAADVIASLYQSQPASDVSGLEGGTGSLHGYKV